MSGYFFIAFILEEFLLKIILKKKGIFCSRASDEFKNILWFSFGSFSGLLGLSARLHILLLHVIITGKRPCSWSFVGMVEEVKAL